MAALFTVGFIVLVLVCGYFAFNDDDRDDTWRGW
jgi:hypothetical protein